METEIWCLRFGLFKVFNTLPTLAKYSLKTEIQNVQPDLIILHIRDGLSKKLFRPTPDDTRRVIGMLMSYTHHGFHPHPICIPNTNLQS